MDTARYPRAIGEIQGNTAIHVTENLNRLKKAQRELSQINGFMPDVFQLAERLTTVDEIKDLMCKARRNVTRNQDWRKRDTSLMDLLEDETQLPSMLLEQSCVKEDIRSLIGDLPEMQAAVISMRYGIGEEIVEPMSMTAIGQVLNMSRDRVRTLENKALKALRLDSSKISEYL